VLICQTTELVRQSCNFLRLANAKSRLGVDNELEKTETELQKFSRENANRGPAWQYYPNVVIRRFRMDSTGDKSLTPCVSEYSYKLLEIWTLMVSWRASGFFCLRKKDV
jgi:hypothetical protein